MKPALMFFVLLVISVPNICLSQKPHKVKINSDKVLLRTTPNTQSKVLAKLNKDEEYVLLKGGDIEYIDSYGNNAWLKIKTKKRDGYVYGALVSAPQSKGKKIKLDTTGYVNENNVNVRLCPNIKCPVIYQFKQGTYLDIKEKTVEEDSLQYYGNAPWYYVQLNRRKGYIYGGVVQLEKGTLSSSLPNARLTKRPDTSSIVIDSISSSNAYSIVEQSETSELIRPYGRHYWYKVSTDKGKTGWVFGAFTNKNNADVNCQCVDFVKNELEIKGVTRNAYRWHEILYGYTDVTQNDKKVTLEYDRVYDDVQKGDIVIFDRLHYEANDQYGHIGFVHEILNKSVIVLGANHKVSPVKYFNQNRCNNVSLKTYIIDDNVQFFRPISK